MKKRIKCNKCSGTGEVRYKGDYHLCNVCGGRGTKNIVWYRVDEMLFSNMDNVRATISLRDLSFRVLRGSRVIHESVGNSLVHANNQVMETYWRESKGWEVDAAKERNAVEDAEIAAMLLAE